METSRHSVARGAPPVHMGAASVAAAILLFALPCGAELEWTADLSVGGGAVVNREPLEGLARFGAHTELTFLRRTNRDFGLGLYAEVMTSSFRDVMTGPGALVLLPISRAYPIVLFAGAYYSYDGGHAIGTGGRLWFGLHNHNHFHPYNGTLGLWVEARAELWGGDDVLIAAGVDIDFALLVYPWFWIAKWAEGPERL